MSRTAVKLIRRLYSIFGSQRAVAKALGVSDMTVSRWLRGGPISDSRRMLAHRIVEDHDSADR
jgi:DNA invertase Pin-like site-specific DNA recombinase